MLLDGRLVASQSWRQLLTADDDEVLAEDVVTEEVIMVTRPDNEDYDSFEEGDIEHLM
jgi:hypothetical protein